MANERKEENVLFNGRKEGNVLFNGRKEGNVLFNGRKEGNVLFNGRKEGNVLFNGRKEGNVLFNDTLNTFYLRLYGVRHMVKNHRDSETGNTLPLHGLLFLISSKGSFICTRITHTTAFGTPVM